MCAPSMVIYARQNNWQMEGPKSPRLKIMYIYPSEESPRVYIWCENTRCNMFIIRVAQLLGHI